LLSTALVKRDNAKIEIAKAKASGNTKAVVKLQATLTKTQETIKKVKAKVGSGAAT
jgi:hypothetical protein